MRLALVAAALIAAMPAPAKACSAPQLCGLQPFLPADGATVPANLPGILWWVNAGDAAMVELHDDAGHQTALTDTGNGVLVPATPLVANTHYTLVDHTPCGSVTSVESSFTTTAEAPLPTALGTLAPVDLGVDKLTQAMPASCSTELTADREGLTLSLDASALPWKDALLFETHVDGAYWSAKAAFNELLPPGSSWTGRGTDLVYAACSALPDGAPMFAVAEGAHTAVMTATLINATVALTSTTAGFALSCTGAPGDATDPSDHGGGCSTGGGTGFAALLGLLALRRRPTRSSAR